VSNATSPDITAPKNRVGTISLIISAVGFLVLEAVHLRGALGGPLWTLLRGGFEASVIGGLADWFAVRAVFRAIPPKPFPALPHTNLVVANRLKLTDGLVDLVEHQLLSPTTLKEQLGRFSASRLIVANLESDSGRTSAINALLSVAERLAGDLEEDEKLRSFVADVIREQLREADLAPMVGAWLLRRIHGGDTKTVWMQVANALADEAEAGSFDSALADALAAAVASVREENTWRGMVFGWFVNPKTDMRHVRTALAKTLRNQATDANHAWNEQLDAAVTRLANGLAARQPEPVATMKKLQEKLAATVDVELLVTHFAADLRVALQNCMTSSTNDCRRMLADLVTRTVERLKADDAAQEKIDAWVRASLQDLASRYHGVIGATARKSIDSLPDEMLVAELESKVGQDLQFIRLNGAVIGGSVGVLIAAARMLVP
jgi:uncharacterized membrane-anchored protein YjiN (DUF445 family)